MFPGTLGTLFLAALLTAGLSAPANAADKVVAAAKMAELARCLTPDQRRSAAASGKVVPLARAIRAAKARRNEVVNAQLCQGPKGLVYLLTVVAGDGKVTRAAIDAQTGKPAEGG
jgi:uncharacterized membrane protein YkoI